MTQEVHGIPMNSRDITSNVHLTLYQMTQEVHGIPMNSRDITSNVHLTL